MKGALQTASEVPSGPWGTVVLASIAFAQADSGDVAGALVTAGSIADQEAMALAYGAVAIVQAMSGDAEGALKTVAPFPDPESLRPAILGEAVLGKVKAGDIAGAFQITSLKGVAAAQAEIGDVAGALATASGIADQAERRDALWKVAVAEAKLGKARAVLAIVAGRDDPPRQRVQTLVHTAAQLLEKPPSGRTVDILKRLGR